MLVFLDFKEEELTEEQRLKLHNIFFRSKARVVNDSRNFGVMTLVLRPEQKRKATDFTLEEFLKYG